MATTTERLDRALGALQNSATGDCHICGHEGGTNNACSACTAITHLSELSEFFLRRRGDTESRGITRQRELEECLRPLSHQIWPTLPENARFVFALFDDGGEVDMTFISDATRPDLVKALEGLLEMAKKTNEKEEIDG